MYGAQQPMSEKRERREQNLDNSDTRHPGGVVAVFCDVIAYVRAAGMGGITHAVTLRPWVLSPKRNGVARPRLDQMKWNRTWNRAEPLTDAAGDLISCR